MNWTYRFITSLLSWSIVVIFLANIAFAFNLVREIPFDTSSQLPNYTDYYFGVSTILESWEVYFQSNGGITFFRNGLSLIRTTMNSVSLTNLQNGLDAVAYTKIGSEIGGDFFATIATLATLLIKVANFLVNIPYIVMFIVYLYLYVFYVLYIAITFVFFIFFMIGGGVYTHFPSYPSMNIDDYIIVPEYSLHWVNYLRILHI